MGVLCICLVAASPYAYTRGGYGGTCESPLQEGVALLSLLLLLRFLLFMLLFLLVLLFLLLSLLHLLLLLLLLLFLLSPVLPLLGVLLLLLLLLVPRPVRFSGPTTTTCRLREGPGTCSSEI